MLTGIPNVDDGFKHADESLKDQRLEKGLILIFVSANIFGKFFLGIGDQNLEIS